MMFPEKIAMQSQPQYLCSYNREDVFPPFKSSLLPSLIASVKANMQSIRKMVVASFKRSNTVVYLLSKGRTIDMMMNDSKQLKNLIESKISGQFHRVIVYRQNKILQTAKYVGYQRTIGLVRSRSARGSPYVFIKSYRSDSFCMSSLKFFYKRSFRCKVTVRGVALLFISPSSMYPKSCNNQKNKI